MEVADLNQAALKAAEDGTCAATLCPQGSLNTQLGVRTPPPDVLQGKSPSCRLNPTSPSLPPFICAAGRAIFPTPPLFLCLQAVDQSLVGLIEEMSTST